MKGGEGGYSPSRSWPSSGTGPGAGTWENKRRLPQGHGQNPWMEGGYPIY